MDVFLGVYLPHILYGVLGKDAVMMRFLLVWERWLGC